MTKKPMRLLRFADLRDRGIIRNWPMLQRRIAQDGFPPGRMIGPNSRAWIEAEVEDWIDSRPTAGPAPRGAAKVRRDRSRKADRTASATNIA
jgi:predicted DNA-binding transcriptional regulator AlpA